jgi:hypothetical protein
MRELWKTIGQVLQSTWGLQTCRKAGNSTSRRITTLGFSGKVWVKSMPKTVTEGVTNTRLLRLGGAALARTGLSFVPSGPASSSFLLLDLMSSFNDTSI